MKITSFGLGLLILVCSAAFASADSRWPDEVQGDVFGPGVVTDEHVPIFDGTSGKLLKSSGAYVDVDDVTDDDVETMGTSGGAGTTPVSDGGGALAMTDIATQSELDAAFIANVPHEAVGSYVQYEDASIVKETTYAASWSPICITDTPTETFDPLGEWVPIDKDMDDAPDCDGGGDDYMLGFCYAPTGYTPWDTTFGEVKIEFQANVWMDAYVANAAGGYVPFVKSEAAIGVLSKRCVCDSNPCEQDEVCTLTSPSSGTPGMQMILHYGSDNWNYDAVWNSSSFTFTKGIRPGTCVGLYVIRVALDATDTFVDGNVSVANDEINAAAHPFVDHDGPLRLTSTGTLPTGLSASTNYYVVTTGLVGAPANYFGLSLTPGGALVDITVADGGGTHTIGTPPDVFNPEQIRLIVSELGARSDKPYQCNFADNAAIGGKCLDNAIVTNVGASGSQTLTLGETPATGVPWCVTIVNQDGADLTVTPHANDTIEGEAQGSSIGVNSTAYDKIQLCNVVPAFWSIMGQKGTW